MPRNQIDSKDVDNGNTDEGRKSHGPAVNRVILVGRLVAYPELRYTSSGSAVAELRLATNEGEEPQFHQLSAWGKLAEFAASCLKKGRLLYVEGRLHRSSWQAADGSQRRGCEVRVGNLQVFSGPSRASSRKGRGTGLPLFPLGRVLTIRVRSLSWRGADRPAGASGEWPAKLR